MGTSLLGNSVSSSHSHKNNIPFQLLSSSHSDTNNGSASSSQHDLLSDAALLQHDTTGLSCYICNGFRKCLKDYKIIDYIINDTTGEIGKDSGGPSQKICDPGQVCVLHFTSKVKYRGSVTGNSYYLDHAGCGTLPENVHLEQVGNSR